MLPNFVAFFENFSKIFASSFNIHGIFTYAVDSVFF